MTTSRMRRSLDVTARTLTGILSWSATLGGLAVLLVVDEHSDAAMWAARAVLIGAPVAWMWLADWCHDNIP